jgi:hypothetical protein
MKPVAGEPDTTPLPFQRRVSAVAVLTGMMPVTVHRGRKTA